MKYFLPAIRFKLFMCVLLGLFYPFVMTGLSQLVFPKEASGDFVSKSGQFVGSLKIAQKFEKPEYFWPRPSAIDYNPLPSGGSNLGQASADLKKVYEERLAKIKAAHPEQKENPPQDLLFASASGLDPHISPQAAEYQMVRVAHARNLPMSQVQQLIKNASEARQLVFFGEPTVNVLALNLSLDQLQGAFKAAPASSSEKAVPSELDKTK